MKQTFCKLCGYVGGAGETDCPDCGAPLFTREAAPAEAPAKKVDIIQKTKDRPSHPRLGWAAGFLAVCLAVQGTGLWLTQRSKPQAWSYASFWRGGGLVTPQGVWQAEEGELYAVSANAGPQRVLVGWRDSDSDEAFQRVIYYYDGRTLEKTDWENADISEDGKALFYLTGVSDRGQALVRRDIKTGREEELARAERLALNNIDSAGTACAYIAGSAETFDTPQAQRFLWQASTGTSRALEEDSFLGALGRDGDNYIVYSDGQLNGGVDGDDWICRMVWSKRGEYTDIKTMHYLVDRDLTELLYRGEDGYWRYENEAGLTAELPGLPRGNDLGYVRSAGAYYNARPDGLTGRVYYANGHLYCLGEDLTVTDLTGDGTTISDTVFNEETQTLYYCQTDMGKVGGALYRIKDPCSDRRETTLLVDQDARAYAVSQDDSTLCVCVWEGKPVNAATWKVSVDGGPFRPLEHAKSTQGFGGDWSVLPVNDGGCWYLANNTNLRRELWYRAPDGTETLKLTYTSPASSTLYDDPPETVALPWTPAVTNLSLDAVGDGSQALALVEREGDTSVTGLVSALSGGSLTRDVGYWLLEADGAMRELEVLTP